MITLRLLREILQPIARLAPFFLQRARASVTTMYHVPWRLERRPWETAAPGSRMFRTCSIQTTHRCSFSHRRSYTMSKVPASMGPLRCTAKPWPTGTLPGLQKTLVPATSDRPTKSTRAHRPICSLTGYTPTIPAHAGEPRTMDGGPHGVEVCTGRAS